MARYALLYPIQPGKADVAERVFQGSGDPPLEGNGVALRNTSVFRQGDSLVRVFDFDGSLEDLATLLASAAEVQQVGESMGRLFTGDYDFTTADGLRAFFTDNLMTTVTDRTAAVVSGDPA